MWIYNNTRIRSLTRLSYLRVQPGGLTDIPTLFTLTKLRTLKYHSRENQVLNDSILGNLTNLTHLEIYPLGNELTNASFRKLSNLRKLSLHGWEGGVSTEIFLYLPLLKKLILKRMSHWKASNYFPISTQLKSLALEDTEFPLDGLFLAVPGLTSLSILCCKFFNDSHLSGLSGMKKLRLHDPCPYISGEAIARLTRLEKLLLRNNHHITVISISLLAPSLKYMDLEYDDDDKWKILYGLQRMTNLTYLRIGAANYFDLFNCLTMSKLKILILDSPAADVANNITKLSSLKKLSLYDTDQMGVEKIGSLTNLQSLSIENTLNFQSHGDTLKKLTNLRNLRMNDVLLPDSSVIKNHTKLLTIQCGNQKMSLTEFINKYKPQK